MNYNRTVMLLVSPDIKHTAINREKDFPGITKSKAPAQLIILKPRYTSTLSEKVMLNMMSM